MLTLDVRSNSLAAYPTYVYAYFHRDGQRDLESAFAAVPRSRRGGKRTFDEAGLPLYEAGLAMPLKYTFISKVTLFEHERGRYTRRTLVL